MNGDRVLFDGWAHDDAHRRERKADNLAAQGALFGDETGTSGTTAGCPVCDGDHGGDCRHGEAGTLELAGGYDVIETPAGSTPMTRTRDHYLAAASRCGHAVVVHGRYPSAVVGAVKCDECSQWYIG